MVPAWGTYNLKEVNQVKNPNQIFDLISFKFDPSSYQANLTMALSRLAGFLSLRQVVIFCYSFTLCFPIILLVQVGEKVGEDLRDTWHLIFLSLFSSCLLSFTWLLLMRLLAAPMLWLSILLAVLLLATTTAYSGLRLSAAISSEDPSVSRNFFQVLGC